MIPESIIQNAVSDMEFTSVQITVLRMVCEGESNGQIAQVTQRSSASVERIIKSLCEGFKAPPIPLRFLNRRCWLVNEVWAKGFKEYDAKISREVYGGSYARSLR